MADDRSNRPQTSAAPGSADDPTLPIVVGHGNLRIADVVAIARHGVPVSLRGDADWRAHIVRGAAYLERLYRDGNEIYGVTTGFGDSCTVSIPRDLVDELPLHLTRFHGCGLGREFDPQTGRAILAVRLASLSLGYSGVRLELLELLRALINADIIPAIPEEGSVGASGDLTPLSYVAATLVGEREVTWRGARRDAADALREAGLQALTLQPKEGLALMNGTAVMTALACLAYDRAAYLTQLATRITATVTIALQGNPAHFDERLFSLKPHPGQTRIAAWLRQDLAGWDSGERHRLQDRYSVRCAPHVIGVLADAMPWFQQVIETEINSVNDNPVIDAENERILHGGHFYGGHIAFVMDAMKTAVANLADLLDRQLALLVDPRSNNGLPANLSGSVGSRAAINHGFKAVQIAVSAWTAEALKLTMPASVFSRSTECHNQDKVSMGTIAARDCLRVLELTEQVAAACLLASCQGLALRTRDGELDPAQTPAVTALAAEVATVCPFLDEDRPLDTTLRATLQHLRAQDWALYE